jgi:hypothetical protein
VIAITKTSVCVAEAVITLRQGGRVVLDNRRQRG